MFRWGVAQELVTPSTADALKYVSPLRQGRTTAPESPPREDVPDEVVEATLPYLLPTVAAMGLAGQCFGIINGTGLPKT
jgi:hypothetical protein